MTKVTGFSSGRSAVVFGVLLAAFAAFAQSVPAAVDPLGAITSAITTILAIIALGGAGYITLRLAHVGWVVGAKFIARLGGKA